MNHIHLGKAPKSFIEKIQNLIELKHNNDTPYEWIMFDYEMQEVFNTVFPIPELKILHLPNNVINQKAFFVMPDSGFRPHKDGINCKCALNIAVSCNEGDWVRWYDEDYINSISATHRNNTSEAHRLSRNTDLHEYADIPFVDEMRQNIGDVYLVNTDVYHSFKCSGPNNRIIIQTKLAGNPTISEVYENLKYYFK
jgi:hypothetical protein